MYVLQMPLLRNFKENKVFFIYMFLFFLEPMQVACKSSSDNGFYLA